MDSVIWLKFKDLSYALYIKKVITWSLDLSYESSPIKRSITMYTPETRAVQLATRINIISWLRLLILILSGNTHSLNFVIVLANLHFVGNIWLSLLRISFVCTLTSPQHHPPPPPPVIICSEGLCVYECVHMFRHMGLWELGYTDRKIELVIIQWKLQCQLYMKLKGSLNINPEGGTFVSYDPHF